MMKAFSFRIETNTDGVEIIDPRQSTEFESLNLRELRRYLEVEEQLYYMERRKRQQAREEEHRRKLLYKLAVLLGVI